MCFSFLFRFNSTRLGLNATQPPRCTEDEKRELYNRLDPSGGGAGISCADLVGFVEGAADDYGGGAAPAASDTAFAALTAPAFQDEEGGMGKLLRRTQATIVEAAQVPLFILLPLPILTCSTLQRCSGVRTARHVFGSRLSARLLVLH